MKLQVSTKFRRTWCRRLLVVNSLTFLLALAGHSPFATVVAGVGVVIAAISSI